MRGVCGSLPTDEEVSMKGRARILLFVMVLIMAWSAVSAGQRIFQMELDKLLRPGLSIVKYNRTAYHFYNNDPVAITMTSLDDRYVELKMDLIGPVPTTIVTLYWDSYPINSLSVEAGGNNTWTLDSETGYAEK
jgi:hypothetical protein